MKITLALLFVFILTVSCFSQKSVSDLKPPHAAALKQFLLKNKNYQFLSSKVITDEYLKYMRESFGKTFEPYYRAGDFNGDKIPDFAVIVSRSGKRKMSGATSEEHKYDYPLAVVIFNGNKNGTFTKALVEDTEAPHACFLDIAKNGKTRLYFGVFETDSHVLFFAPVRKGYKVEFPEEFQ